MRVQHAAVVIAAVLTALLSCAAHAPAYALCPRTFPGGCEDASGARWCCPESHSLCGEYPDCYALHARPGGAASEYLVAINTSGSDEPGGQPSGTLPGFSPAVAGGIRFRDDGVPLPQWRERRAPDSVTAQLRRAGALPAVRSAPASPRIYSRGQTVSFWVSDDADSAIWRLVSATVAREGSHSYLFVDNSISVPDAALDLYVAEFETMYSVMTSNIGTFSDRDGNGKVAILLYDIDDGGSAYGGYMGGYFWSKDYYGDSLVNTQFGWRSNEMDIIYVRGDEPAGWDSSYYGDFYEYNLTTLVHEFQHLTHFSLKIWQSGGNNSDTWIDEMMAMAAETMYFKAKLENDSGYLHPDMLSGGYLYSRISYYNEDSSAKIRNGHGLTYWDPGGDVLANYALSYLFGQYLALQAASGQGIFKDIITYMLNNSGSDDYRGVLGAAAQQISGIATWEDLLRNWAIANMLNRSTGPYGYGGQFSVTAHGPTSDSVTLENGGMAYRSVSGSWSEPVDAGAAVQYYSFDSSGAAVSDTSTTTTVAASTTTTIEAADTTTTSSSSASGSTTTTSIWTDTTTTTVESATTTTTTTATDEEDECTAEKPLMCRDDAAGVRWCCPVTNPLCGSGEYIGYCYASAESCPAALLLGDDAGDLDIVREFRDEVLLAAPGGAGLAALYYRHADEVSGLLAADAGLRRRARRLLQMLLPALWSAAAGQPLALDDEVRVPLRRVAFAIAAQGSTGLQQAVRLFFSDLEAERLRPPGFLPQGD